jgi:hypothetical protein
MYPGRSFIAKLDEHSRVRWSPRRARFYRSSRAQDGPPWCAADVPSRAKGMAAHWQSTRHAAGEDLGDFHGAPRALRCALSAAALAFKYKLPKLPIGDVIYLNVLGTPLLVLNERRAAQDLLDERGARYADRPRMPMVGVLCGYDDTLPIMPYGARFRTTRRLMHQFMGARTRVDAFARVEEDETARFLLRVLRDPRAERLREHVRK